MLQGQGLQNPTRPNYNLQAKMLCRKEKTLIEQISLVALINRNQTKTRVLLGYYLAEAALWSWKSKVWTRPCGATARAREVVREPLPVPDSSTTHPGTSSR
jgi:hypothetical protein